MDPAAKSSGVPFSQAKEDESGLWQKSNCVVGLHPAATAEHVLQRADARSAAVDAMAEKGAGDRRAGSFGSAVDFQPCPGSGLVGPEMPEIRARLTPGKTTRNCAFGKNGLETASKEQQGGQSAPAIVTMARS